jgi:hypothetical protein
MGVAHRVADLLEGAARRKHGKAGGKGDLPAGRQASGHAHHVALGNAALNEAVWVCLAKILHFCGVGQIGYQHHNIRIRLSQLHQGFAEALPGGFFHNFSHLHSLPFS